MSDSELGNRVLGAKLSMRAAARHILGLVDEMTEAEMRASGWSTADLAALERLAAMPIAGIPFGQWPR